MILRHLRTNVVAYLALLVAMSGTSYAAVKIADGSVTTRKLAKNAVVSTKIRNEGVKSIDIRNNSVGSADIRDSSVNSSDLQDGSVSSADVKDRSLTRGDLATGAVPNDAQAYATNLLATNPPAVADMPGQNAFSFTTPRAGRALLDFFAGEFGVDCTSGTGSIGMYVDGAPVTGTARFVPAVGDGAAVRLVAETGQALPAGAHTVSIGEDCATGDRTGATPGVEQRATWTVELLAR